MPEPLLALSGVHTHIGQYHILQGVDFIVPAGGITVLVGRNGAGKTTTLRTIMGLWKPSKGSVRFAGRELGGFATAHARFSAASWKDISPLVIRSDRARCPAA